MSSKISRTNTGSLTENAHAKIIAMIVSGELEPGQKISEKTLSEQLRIGRTPVREAVRLLATQDVMEQLPRYGTFVKKQELRDIMEIFEVREAMESFAVYNATQKLGAEDMERLQKLFLAMEDIAQQVREEPTTANDPALTMRIVEADQAFHLHLMHAAGNRRIVKILTDTQVLARAFTGKVAQQNPDMIENTYRDHKALWQALTKGDGTAARDIMIQHIRKSRQEAVDYFERYERRDGTRPEWPSSLEEPS